MSKIDIEEVNSSSYWDTATKCMNREIESADITEKLDYLCDFGIITNREQRKQARDIFRKCISLNELDRTYHAMLIRESIA